MPDKIRIAVVDDNTDFLEILCEYLSIKDGLEVVGTASDGIEAVEMITRIRPDLVILDIVMPKLDGLDVLERINSLHMDKKPQFIMLSAIGQREITQKALALGAEYFIIKPFDMDDLSARIRQLYSLKGQREIFKIEK